jgi:hypothetical protein
MQMDWSWSSPALDYLELYYKCVPLYCSSCTAAVAAHIQGAALSATAPRVVGAVGGPD